MISSHQIYFIIAGIFLSTFITQKASAYNTAGFPFTAINEKGDYVIASDKKSIVKLDGKYIKIPFRIKKSNYRTTGGITNNTDTNQILACLGSEIYSISSDDMSLKLTDFGNRLTQCAMLDNGTKLFYLKDKSKIIVDGKTIERVPVFHSWHASGDKFIGISLTGNLYIVENGILEKTSVRLSGTEDFTSIAARFDSIVHATSYGVHLYDISDLENPVKRRLPISPCADKQICGTSIGYDGSVVVSGYWGHWIVINGNATRLDLPQLSRKSGGTGISHTKNGSRYLMVSFDDADIGTLPRIQSKSLNSLTDSIKLDGYIVWSKKEPKNPIFNYKLKNGVVIYVGRVESLPSTIPSEWIYYAANEELTTELPIQQKSFFYTDEYWWHGSIGLAQAQSKVREFNRRDVKVAIVDSGINLANPDFSHITEDQILAYDFVEEEAIARDEHGHGSHVAGIIAGNRSGIMPDANLVIARALDKKGKSNSIDLARAIVWAADQNPQVMNFSWGGGFKTQAVRDAIYYVKEKNILMLTSAGNSRIDVDKFPEVPVIYGGVLSIASYNKNMKLAKHSNFGKNTVSFALPGENILSSHLGDNTEEMTGTSMAVAVASGTVALISSLETEQGFFDAKELPELLCDNPDSYWKKYTRCAPLILDSVLDRF